MKNSFKRCASILMLILLLAGLVLAIMPALAETAETTTTETTVVTKPPKPKSVKLSSSKTIRVAIDGKLTLTPTLKPSNAQTTFKWKSSNKKVATVSGGVVKPKKVGTTTITVTTANKKKSKVKVKVYDPYLPKSVKLDQKGTIRLPLGDKLTLTPTMSPENAKSKLKWKSSKKKIASVSGGVVKAKKVGTTTITVTTRNKKKAKVKVKVYDPYLPTSITLDKSGTQKLMFMNKLQLKATLHPDIARSKIKWKTSKWRVATVNSNGLVTAKSPGTAKITAITRNKKKVSIKIKVVDDGNQPITTGVGYKYPYVIYACKNTHTIAIVAKDSKGNWTRVIRLFSTGMGRKNVTDVGIFYLTKKERWHRWGSGYSPYACKTSIGVYVHGPIYKSKNMNTIRPSFYNVIGRDCSSGCLRTTCGCASWIYYNCPVGTQIVVAQNSKFSTPRPKKIKSNAHKDPTDPGSHPEVLITKFDVLPDSLKLTKGATKTIKPFGMSPSNTSTKTFSYASSNTSVAKVSASGVVTAVGPGSATIVVTANDDFKCAVSVPVTVTSPAAAADLKLAAADTVDDDASLSIETLDDTAQEDVEAAVDNAEENVDTADEAASETILEDDFDADEAVEIIAGTDDVTEPETTDADEDNGLSAETEEIPEEVSETFFEEENE